MAIPQDLMEVQVGKETTWGTPVAPTAKLMGIETCEITPVNDVVQVPEMRGSLQRAFLSALGNVGGTGRLEGAVLYEDIVYLLDSLMSEDTPSGAGPYTYEHNVPTTAVSTPRKMTLVKGQGSDVYALEGALVDTLTISGETGAEARFTADLIGENAVSDALAALSDRSVNLAMADHLALYVDAWGGTIGTTQIDTALAFLSYELTLQANRRVYPGMGQLPPKGFHDRNYSGQLKLVMEFNATSAAYFDEIIGQSAVHQRQIQIKYSNGANLDLQLDFAGTSLAAPVWNTEDDGLVTVEITYTDEYNSALGNWFKATTINGLSAMP